MTFLKHKTLRPLWPALVALLLASGGTAWAQDEESEVRAEVLLSQDRIRPGDSFHVAVVIDIEDGYHVYAPGVTGGLIPLSIRGREGPQMRFESVTLPEGVEKEDPSSGDRVPLYEGTITAFAKVKASAELSGKTAEVAFEIDYQACTDEYCLPPTKGLVRSVGVDVAAAGEEVKPLHAEVFASLAGADKTPPEAGVSGDIPKGEFEDLLEKKGLLLAVLLAFVAGLVAAVSPCVYPMIPITISYFGSQARARGQTITLAITYVLGICLTYTILGVGTSLLGKELGAVLQNPWMLGAFAVLFVALALSMFGLFELRLPSGLATRLGGGKQGVLGALAMGGVLGFVAAPCVGPFLGGILLYVGQSQDVVIGTVTLFTFGLGMGIPFLGLAICSGSVAAMPRAGNWLVKLKSFFGLVMLGVAVYFLSLSQAIPELVIALLYAVLLIVIGVFLGTFRKSGEKETWASIVARSAGILALLLGGYLFVGTVARVGVIHPPFAFEGRGVAQKTDWIEPKTEEAFDRALEEAKAAGRPAMVDFWAFWCSPCKIMDKTVFADPEVQAALESFAKIKVDCTDDDSPGGKIRFERFNAKAMPSIFFFGPDGKQLTEKAIRGKIGKDEFLRIVRSITEEEN